ncbi:type II secretion system protein GspD [Azonexus sp.]|uniref:type II secretion system protein GspD n=1 Tax=Azonexus sp. TaxID=1872668 RepID=UPI0035AED58E
MFKLMSLLFATFPLLTACSAPVPRQALAGHLHARPAPGSEDIPAIVEQMSPLPTSSPATPRPADYSVSVDRIPVRDLLFALARDARIDIDIAPEIEGKVTLNALHQPLEVILERIARQIPLNFEFSGDSLLIVPDKPYLAHYPVDYVNLERSVTTSVANNMQIGASTGSTNAGNLSATRIENVSRHHFWENLKAGLEQLLESNPAGGGKAANPQRLIINGEGGLVSAIATRRQHRQIRSFIDQLSNAVRRQVLIEATIVEVALSEGHEQGIDWSSLISGGIFELAGNPLKTGINLRYDRNANPKALISLLDRFGDSRVLSSPRLSVLNNQTALLKVVENYVYFTVKADTTTTANVGTSVTYTTTPQTVSVGLVMGVTPQVAADDSVILNIRPTITSVGREIPDPNPDLRRNGIENLVPVIRTREIESVMRVANGQIAVLGGLMEDGIDHRNQRIPLLGEIPGAGEVFTNRDNRAHKTELVIFLRPTVIREASLSGDYSGSADALPTQGFFPPPRPTAPAPLTIQ